MQLASSANLRASRPVAGRCTVLRKGPRTAHVVRAQYSNDYASQTEGEALISRRNLLLAAGAITAGLPLLAPGRGNAAELVEYLDPLDGFTLRVPDNWVIGEGAIAGNSSFSGASGKRRTVVWYPEGANVRDVNVSMVVTNVSVEFTKLGSFGTPFQFASNLVNSQDRSYLLKGPKWGRQEEPVQIARLVDSGEFSNKYYLEYTIQKLPEKQRHLYSSLGLAPNGMYNRLYTVTAQCLEEDREQYEATLQAIVRSLGLPAPRV